MIHGKDHFESKLTHYFYVVNFKKMDLGFCDTYDIYTIDFSVPTSHDGGFNGTQG